MFDIKQICADKLEIAILVIKEVCGWYRIEQLPLVGINGRISRTLAWFIPDENRIEFSRKILVVGSDDEIKDTARHEAIHFVLDQLGLPSNDGDKCFEATLKRHHISSTKTFAYSNKQSSEWQRLSQAVSRQRYDYYLYCELCGAPYQNLNYYHDFRDFRIGSLSEARAMTVITECQECGGPLYWERTKV